MDDLQALCISFLKLFHIKGLNETPFPQALPLVGLMVGGITSTSMTKLPDECIPTKRLTFNMISGDGTTQRVDVLTSGMLLEVPKAFFRCVISSG